MEGNYLFLYDSKNRLSAVNPDLIRAMIPLDKFLTLVIFDFSNGSRIFRHSIEDILNGVETYYNAV